MTNEPSTCRIPTVVDALKSQCLQHWVDLSDIADQIEEGKMPSNAQFVELMRNEAEVMYNLAIAFDDLQSSAASRHE